MSCFAERARLFPLVCPLLDMPFCGGLDVDSLSPSPFLDFPFPKGFVFDTPLTFPFPAGLDPDTPLTFPFPAGLDSDSSFSELHVGT